MGIALYMLSKPAEITNRCNGTSPLLGRKGIRSVVNGFACTAERSPAEADKRLTCLEYLNSTTAGVEIFGTPITFALIVRMFSTMGGYSVIAVGLLHDRVRFD